MRTFRARVAILRADADLFGFLMDRVNQRVGRRHGDLDLHVTLRGTIDRACFGKHGARAVHFPVSDDVGPFGHVLVLRFIEMCGPLYGAWNALR